MALIRPLDLAYLVGATVSSPILAFNLLRTGKWRTDWRGRFGHRPPLPEDARSTVLLHAVSVGEINATRRIVELLERSASPPVRVVVSATTNTGFARAVELYGDRHPVVRFPFDLSGAVTRFLDAVQPDVVALMELEVWPNFASMCEERGIPLCVVNGRLSAASYRNYLRVRPLVRRTFGRLSAAAAQTPEYAERFRDLGVPHDRVHVTDTMKWEAIGVQDGVPGADALAEELGIDRSRPVVVAGSTGPGEERVLAEGRPEGVQLIVVPRKPERFEAVARDLPDAVRRSRPEDRRSGASLFLLDTMGELEKAYSLADVAIVGRSLIENGGGSDPIQPIALGAPAVIGPHHIHFHDVVGTLAETGALVVSDRPMEVASELLEDPARRAHMVDVGRRAITERVGASARAVELIIGLL